MLAQFDVLTYVYTCIGTRPSHGLIRNAARSFHCYSELNASAGWVDRSLAAVVFTQAIRFLTLITGYQFIPRPCPRGVVWG